MSVMCSCAGHPLRVGFCKVILVELSVSMSRYYDGHPAKRQRLSENGAAAFGGEVCCCSFLCVTVGRHPGHHDFDS